MFNDENEKKEKVLILLLSRIVCAGIEAAGMVAENKFREQCGNTVAYSREHFQELISKYHIGYNDMCKTLGLQGRDR